MDDETDVYVMETFKDPSKKLGRGGVAKSTRHDTGTCGIEHETAVDSILNGTDNDSEWEDLDNEDAERQILVQTVSIRNDISEQGKEAINFLHEMDKDIRNILTSTKSSQKRNLNEVCNSLTCRRIYPLKRRNSYLGDDCGIKIGPIICVIIFVAIVVPLAYYLYYEYVKKPQLVEHNR